MNISYNLNNKFNKYSLKRNGFFYVLKSAQQKSLVTSMIKLRLNWVKVALFSVFMLLWISPQVSVAQAIPHASGIKLFPLTRNPLVTNPPKFNPLIVQRSITDTLTLPFFEDFSQELGYPRGTRFTDKQVWINNNFGIKPPSYGVATFDHLDAYGNPYDPLNKMVSVFADSLTSQPINLQYYWSGANTINYKPTDSIYISFFVQLQGLGDIPDSEDSLLLYFKNRNGDFERVWGIKGGKQTPFIQYFVAIDQYDYFIPDFQFRFVNFTKASGNLNHWHLDYIRIDKNRTVNYTDIQDVAISTLNLYPIKNFSNVPYKHYFYNKSTLKGTGYLLGMNNLNANTAVQTRIGLTIKNQYNQQLYNIPPFTNVRNLAANRDSIEKFDGLLFDTLSGATPKLSFEFEIQPQGNDETPTQFNSTTNNNKISMEHTFMPWYSYDDGSAEGGFGLDYENLGNIKGQFAMEFDVQHPDSLRGLAIYFNQSLNDVSGRNFRLRVWRALSPIGAPDKQDLLIYEFPIDRPVYTDSINHFSFIFFDSVLYLPKGKYYAGWQQSVPFILNVGYDNNYRYNYGNNPNPHLFYNLLGSWERSDPSIMGTPMIRMLFGERIDYSFGTVRLESLAVKTFPNPCTHWISVSGWIPEHSLYEIRDVRGVKMQEGVLQDKLDVVNLPNGNYQLIVRGKDGSLGICRFIKL